MQGNVYIADLGNNRVRKVSSGGTITTIGGTGVHGLHGGRRPGNLGAAEHPSGVAVDGKGNVYIADTGPACAQGRAPAGRSRRSPARASAGSPGTAARRRAARLNEPDGVAVDGHGNLYIADYGNSRVRR